MSIADPPDLDRIPNEASPTVNLSVLATVTGATALHSTLGGVATDWATIPDMTATTRLDRVGARALVSLRRRLFSAGRTMGIAGAGETGLPAGPTP